MNKRVRKSYWSISKFAIGEDVKYFLRLEKRINNKETEMVIEIPFGTYSMIRTRLEMIEKEPEDIYKEMFYNDDK